MSTLCDVTVVLNHTPAKALHQALTAPIPGSDGQSLALLDTDKAGGSKVYTGTIYAACFNHIIVDDLETFFRSIQARAWGACTGIVIVDHENEDGLIVNRVGYQA